jgi:tetratricopeptide (TPR) repeat protein
MDFKERGSSMETIEIGKLIAESLEICRSNPQRGVELADASLNSSISESNTAQAFACKGACQVWLGDHESALKNLFNSLALFEDLHDPKFESHALYHVFCAFYFLADYDNALKYASEMLMRAEKNNDIHAQANALNGIGSVYYTSGENQKAIDTLLKALAVAEKLEDKHLLARILDGLGSAYFNIKDIERAIDFKERSLETARPIGLKNVESFALDGLARIYFAANAFKISEKLFLDCLSIREEINFKSGIAETNLHLGELFLKQKFMIKH